MNHAYGTPGNASMLPRIKIRGYKTKPSLRLCKKKIYFVGLQQFQSGVYIIVAGWWEHQPGWAAVVGVSTGHSNQTAATILDAPKLQHQPIGKANLGNLQKIFAWLAGFNYN